MTAAREERRSDRQWNHDSERARGIRRRLGYPQMQHRRALRQLHTTSWPFTRHPDVEGAPW